MHGKPQYRIDGNRMYTTQLFDRLQKAIEKKIADRKHCLALYISSLKGLSPLEKLSMGYSYTTDINGKTIKDVDAIDIGDQVKIAVRNGTMITKVLEKEKVDRENGYGTR